MTVFTKESLETLRQRIDLVDVLSAHLDLKRTGASYKALCPFHDEKTASFVVQKGDNHYHCFGCGAHGDAIHFLMNHLKMSFLEAVEYLANRFHVHLDRVEHGEGTKTVNKARLREALSIAMEFYHFALLHTPEGHQALHYLYQRGIDLGFIQYFKIGFAPPLVGMLRKVLHARSISDEVMLEAGLLIETKEGKKKEFFSDRILFPIHHPSSGVIGFSGRKFKEETFGGKYVNTAETPLFKKSRVLFGLNYCRKRIAKERRAIIVEGQIDALRLIYTGFNLTVAGQGTAFGEGHVKELMQLGVQTVYLALDPDGAGQEAAAKIGNLFQKEGVDIKIVSLPPQMDPDVFLRERGPEAFQALLQKSVDYLPFLVSHLSKKFNCVSPAGKNELVQTVTAQIQQWNHPVMVHESLRQLAHLMQVPESVVTQDVLPRSSHAFVKKGASIGTAASVDPDRILECDLLRWMLLMGETHPHLIEMVGLNLKVEDFSHAACGHLFTTFLEGHQNQKAPDLLSLAIALDNEEGQTLISEILEKKINKEKAEEHFKETVQRILDRNWMKRREEIKMKIQSGQLSDDEALDLVKQFDELKRHPPQLKTK
ncbi:DNA primase [Parachlamydia sp. AcF125]|uniref:DNA primase n=1 Tax=Parachlamydia sp. AcF125 TaxID=2795736 RepID=UPI001BC9B0C5|nr:DNA primase [Parachlamydia sp. AcF125]MBS4168598.1 DNA primase [Parachlamydia sp. AcF125]